MANKSSNRPPSVRALWVAASYGLLAAVWIIASDRLVSLLFSDPRLLTLAQTLKGWAFVLVTAAALFAMLYRQFRHDHELLNRYQDQREELRSLSRFRESVIDDARIWINALDPQARVTVWNKAAEQISGYPREQVLGNAEVWQLLYPDPDYRAQIAATARDILDDGTEVEELETTIVCRDGTRKIMAWNSRRFFDASGELVGSIAIGRDITDRKRAEQALRASERQLATLMANLPGMAYRCANDRCWTMRFVSEGCAALTGYRAEALLDNAEVAFGELVDERDRERLWQEVQAAIAQNRAFAVEYRLRRRQGEVIWVWEHGQAVELDGELVLEGIVLDITDRKEMEQELAELATRDTLTGLYNRRELEGQLREEVQRAERYQRPLALLWIDVDHFKGINDRHGHAAGDTVLREISHQLRGLIRNVDYIGRFGGEEFIIVLPELSLQDALDMANRLQAAVADYGVALAGGEVVRVTISVGVAAFPEHGRTPEALCRAADTAMYQAKALGRNQVCSAAAAPVG